MTNDETREIVRRHMAAWQRGDIQSLLADYTDDIVMMSAMVGVVAGKDAIAAMYEQVFADLFRPDDTRLEVTTELVSDDHGLIHWVATTSKVRTVGGFDTFAFRDGLIAVQCGGAEIVPLD